MFHQPDLDALLFDRVAEHPLIDLQRGVDVRAIEGVRHPLTAAPVAVLTRRVDDETAQTFTGRLVLGCDGANSTIRQLVGVTTQDLGFTERWLVVDIRAATPWTPGTVSSRSATPPAPPPSCRSTATATGGSSSYTTVRTRPT